MIKLGFSEAIALYILIFLAVILAAWIFSRKGKHKDFTLDPRFTWFCSICAYTYINTKEEAISTCPRCGSYNKK